MEHMEYDKTSKLKGGWALSIPKWIRVVISVILMTAIANVLCMLCFRVTSGLAEMAGIIVSSIMEVLLMTLLLLGFCRLTGKRFGAFFSVKGLWKGLLLLLPYFAYNLLGIWYYNANMKIILPLLIPLIADVYMEEVTYRCIISSYGLMLCRDRRDFPKAVLLSGLYFGLSHYINLLSGNSFINVTRQAIGAVFSGILMTAAFCVTESIIPGMLTHTFMNILYDAIIWGSGVADVGTIALDGTAVEALSFSEIMWNLKMDMIIYIVPVIIMFLLRDSAARKKQEAS